MKKKGYSSMQLYLPWNIRDSWKWGELIILVPWDSLLLAIIISLKQVNFVELHFVYTDEAWVGQSKGHISCIFRALHLVTSSDFWKWPSHCLSPNEILNKSGLKPAFKNSGQLNLKKKKMDSFSTLWDSKRSLKFDIRCT